MTERLCSKTGSCSEERTQDHAKPTQLTEASPSAVQVPCQAALPLSVPPASSSSEQGEREKFSVWVIQTTGRRFATWAGGHCTLAVDFTPT